MDPAGVPGPLRPRACSRNTLEHSRTFFLPTLGPATLSPGEGSKRHTKTLNIDLICSDRARSLDSGSEPHAAGTVPAAASLEKVLPMILSTAVCSAKMLYEDFVS